MAARLLLANGGRSYKCWVHQDLLWPGESSDWPRAHVHPLLTPVSFRSSRPTRRATPKAPSSTAATFARGTSVWTPPAMGAWPPPVQWAWPCRKGQLSASLTSAPPSFCCSKLLKTSASTCSPASESELEKDWAASDWLSWERPDDGTNRVYGPRETKKLKGSLRTSYSQNALYLGKGSAKPT